MIQQNYFWSVIRTNQLRFTTWLGHTTWLRQTNWFKFTFEAACFSIFICSLPSCGTTSAIYNLQTSALMHNLHSETTRLIKMNS